MVTLNHEEYTKLVQEANKHADSYYINDVSLITDGEYDKLIRRIRDYEEQHPNNISKDSPTQKVSNGTKKGFSKIKHINRMWSILDIFPGEDLTSFCNTIKGEIYMEPKFDGCSLNLLYENGKLVRGITRGDGFIGEDVTKNVLEIDTIPKTINYLEKIEIRGEIVIEIEDFDKINNKLLENNLKTFSNPRNAAAGTLRNKDSSVIKERNLKFYPWGVGYNTLNYKLHSEVMNFIESLGFLREKHFITNSNSDSIETIYKNFKKTRYDYPMMLDGVVIRANDIEEFESLGTTAKYCKGYLAYKFPATEVYTKLLDVKWQVGRTGVVTPVAILEPVTLNNVVVSNATLHNYDFIEKLDIQINDNVSIIRSGDVIPKLGLAHTPDRSNSVKIVRPYNCPCCNSVLEAKDHILRCNNKSCKDRIINNLVYFCSRDIINIDGMSKETITLLHDKGLLNTPIDIYNLKYEDLNNLDGFQDKRINNLLSSINNSRTVELYRFISSLGIDNLGIGTASFIARNFKEDWLNKTYDDYLTLKGVGSVLANNIISYITNNKEYILELSKVLNIVYPKIENVGSLSNKEIVISGDLDKTKGYYRKIIESLGGIWSTNVNANTSYLICNTVNTNKYNKAIKLGIPIISEDDFNKMLDLDKSQDL